MDKRINDLSGKRFGRLTVISISDKRTSGNGVYWNCICDCGVEKEIAGQSLVRRMTSSCGCYNREKCNMIKHGHNRKNKKSITYKSWDKMIQRCTNPNCPEYRLYGQRGISICDEWLDFKNFLNDIGERPSTKHSIDRIDVNGGYCKENCRWATQKQQSNNTRRNVRYNYNGRSMTISELADMSGIMYDTMYCRLAVYKWTVENATSIPVTKKNSRQKYQFNNQ